MRALLATATAALLALAPLLAGCGDAPSKKECEQLLDHVVELELEEAGTDGMSAEAKTDLEKQKQKLRDYVGKEFIDRCVKDLPKKHVSCGLKAANKEALAACDKAE
jgi:hypothetical protein